MEGANQSLFPVIRSNIVDEREEFPADFGLYLQRELNWSRLANDGGGETHVTGWVFWSRRDDEPRYLPVSDCGSENLDDVPDSTPKTQDKIRLALGRIILHPRFGRSLVQYWAATTTIEGRTLLTTRNQPFALGITGRSWGLCEYRMKSMEYKFYGDIGESGEEELGLPGRVFLHRLPESVPNVHYYSLKEYPQRDDATRCHVRASWALPVFEGSSQICVGVLELVSTADAITDWCDKSFLRNLYDVFQELGLQSIDAYKHYQMKYKDEDNALTSAFHELRLVLESVYKLHKLPLALAWVLCSACDALVLGRLSSEGGKYLGAFEANNNHLVDLLTANTGYHLPKGQVAERVLSFPNMLYCKDVTQFSIAEYPLVPFARHCKLSGLFAICLHSSYTGEDVHILEFFLPASSEHPLTTVGMILGTIKENSRTLKLASGKELGEVLSVEVYDFHNGWKSHPMQMIQASRFILNDAGVILPLGQLNQPSFDAINDGMDVIFAEQEDDTVATISKGKHERKCKKTGVNFDISLEDILRSSALNCTEAARILNVNVLTLKRLCRKYGINRWPPCNMNKEAAFPVALPNVGDFLQLDSQEESSWMEFDAAKDGAHDLMEDDSLPSFPHLENNSQPSLGDFTSEEITYFLQSPSSYGEAIGVQNENCRFESIEMSQNCEVMHVDSSAQEPVVAPKRKRTGRHKIQITLEEMQQCINDTVKDAAFKLRVSESTLDRRIKALTSMSWSQFKRSTFAPQAMYTRNKGCR